MWGERNDAIDTLILTYQVVSLVLSLLSTMIDHDLACVAVFTTQQRTNLGDLDKSEMSNGANGAVLKGTLGSFVMI